jgi:general secretion pathway protein N
LPLFLGRARVDLERLEGPQPFKGGASMSRHSFGIEDMTGRLDIGSALAPLPVASLDMTDVSARFVDGQCAAAEGTVRAEVAGSVAGLALPGGLTGIARCDRGALLLPLASQTGMEGLNLRLFEDGRYEIELAVRPVDDAMRDQLIAAGFLLTANGYALRMSGTF